MMNEDLGVGMALWFWLPRYMMILLGGTGVIGSTYSKRFGEILAFAGTRKGKVIKRRGQLHFLGMLDYALKAF
jgi:hypothetical protein